MNKVTQLLTLLLFSAVSVFAQSPTVGLIQYDPGSSMGYTLFSPNVYSKTYFIDNCGNTVNTWQSAYPPGLSAYFLPDGNLLRTARINNSTFSGGGSGGRIEIFDWSGNITWAMNYSDSLHHQHHDVEFLPNGNILILAWEFKNRIDAINSGRNPALLLSSLWPEHIVEIEPIGTSGANIVWEWHVWDHLIQDFDSSVSNFGTVQDHPELIDINFTNSGNQDWLHANSIDYNPVLDQIILSIHNFNEIWIIDHSTTSAEAAGHTGGNSGMGGDLLYRWGNPRAYRRGSVSDQKFWGQHNAHWIEPGLPDAGKIMVFNNGINRTGGNYSSVDVLETPLDSTGEYFLSGLDPYGPDSLYWQYTANPPNSFYSANISSAQRLMNGNTLICEGASGNFFEIDSNKNVVWNYICPVQSTGPVSQGSNPSQNSVFKCYRHSSDYSGLTGHALTPGPPVELNPYPSVCSIFTALPDDKLYDAKNHIEISPDPFNSQIEIRNTTTGDLKITVCDMQGRVHQKFDSQDYITYIRFSTLPPGMFIIKISSHETNIIKRIMKI